MSLPSSFHVVQIGGTIFYVDKDVRREVEAFLRSAPAKMDFITVESLLGEEITVVADAVNGMWDCTPESRAGQREMDRLFKSEVPLDVSDL